jgi:hypothetical protein
VSRRRRFSVRLPHSAVGPGAPASLFEALGAIELGRGGRRRSASAARSRHRGSPDGRGMRGPLQRGCLPLARLGLHCGRPSDPKRNRQGHGVRRLRQEARPVCPPKRALLRRIPSRPARDWRRVPNPSYLAFNRAWADLDAVADGLMPGPSGRFLPLGRSPELDCCRVDRDTKPGQYSHSQAMERWRRHDGSLRRVPRGDRASQAARGARVRSPMARRFPHGNTLDGVIRILDAQRASSWPSRSPSAETGPRQYQPPRSADALGGELLDCPALRGCHRGRASAGRRGARRESRPRSGRLSESSERRETP